MDADVARWNRAILDSGACSVQGRRPTLGRIVALLLVGLAGECLAQDSSQLLDQLRQVLGAGAPANDAAASAEPDLSDDAVRVGPTGLISLRVRGVDIGTVLEVLSYQARTNIVASAGVKGAITANLYDVTLTEALDAILTPNQFAYRRVRNTIFVGTRDEIREEMPKLETRVFRLRHLSKAEAMSVYSSVIGAAPTQAETGSGAGAAAPSPFAPLSLGNGGSGRGPSAAEDDTPTHQEFLIVTDTPERIEALAALLKELDVRPRQVLIEATILRATLNEDNEFGIDFTVLGGIDFQTVGSVSDASTNLQTGPLPSSRLENTTLNVNTNLIQTPPTGGFSFGIIHNSVGAFVRALEEVTDVTVVANPKLVALNRQTAEVIVGRRDGYLTTTVTQTAAIQTVNFLETGTQIRVRPIIADDGSVRLDVHPKDSNGGLTAANLPFEETTEAHANILVNDGHTVLIGGLFRERTVTSRSQVPGLGNIPIAGALVQNRDDATVREEVIILLTVRVLQDTPEDEGAFAGLIDDVERARVGTREGVLGIGRERLAQAYFQEALRLAQSGEHERALLNVRMTLHNQPRHMAALKLRDELENRRAWDDDGSRTRTFLLDLLRERKGGDASGEPPVFDRPGRDLDLLRGQPPRRPNAAPALQSVAPASQPVGTLQPLTPIEE